MGLAQIGEFSFIIAALGVSLNVTSHFLYPIAVAVSAATTTEPLPHQERGSGGGLVRSAGTAEAGAVTCRLYGMGGQLGNAAASMASKFARRWSMQMGLNAVLIAAVFAGGRSSRSIRRLAQKSALSMQARNAVLSFATAVAYLRLIAIFRKLQALGMLVAEVRVTRARAGARTEAIRAVVAQSIVIAGSV